MQCAKAVSGMGSWSVGRVPHLLEGGTAATVGSSWRSSSWSLCCSGLGVVVDWLDACSLVLGSVLPCVVEVRCCTTLAGRAILSAYGVVPLYHLYFLLNTICVAS
jgi:hypothetical protein